MFSNSIPRSSSFSELYLPQVFANNTNLEPPLILHQDTFECGSYEDEEITSSLANERNRRELECYIEGTEYTNFMGEYLNSLIAPASLLTGHHTLLESDFEGRKRHLTLLAAQRAMESKNDDLRELAKRTKMLCIQENGQRRFGPKKKYHGGPPPRGSEVFVGKIPRDCFEPDLYPIFEQAGEIYEIRMMMDFSGSNRGYCFVQYHSPESAQKAIKTLNNFEIRKGRYMGVVLSVDNCRLFIGGLPKDKSKEEIFEEINKLTADVVKVVCYPSINDKTKNRGFAFVQYTTHKAAAMARRKLIPGKITMFGVQIAVDWADPEPDVEIEIMDKVKILYVRNLMLSTTEETLLELFNACSDDSVEKVKKIKDFAFIHFTSREKAEMAKETFKDNDTTVEGSRIEISWAKPPNSKVGAASKYEGRKKSPYSKDQQQGGIFDFGSCSASYYYGNNGSIMMSPNNYHPYDQSSASSFAGSMYGPLPTNFNAFNGNSSTCSSYNAFMNGNSPTNYNNFNGNSSTSYNAFMNGNSPTSYNNYNGNSSTNYNAFMNGNSPPNYNTFNEDSSYTSYNSNERNLHNFGYSSGFQSLQYLNNGSGIMSANNNESKYGYPQLAGHGMPYNTSPSQFLYN